MSRVNLLANLAHSVKNKCGLIVVCGVTFCLIALSMYSTLPMIHRTPSLPILIALYPHSLTIPRRGGGLFLFLSLTFNLSSLTYSKRSAASCRSPTVL